MKSEPPDMGQVELTPQSNICPDSVVAQTAALRGDNGPERPRKMLWAAILSLLLPGLGQVYNGQLVKGLLFWLTEYALALICGSLGLLLLFYGWVLFGGIGLLIYVVALVEAIVTARRLKSIDPRPYNRWYAYVVIILASAALWGVSPTQTEDFSTARMSSASMQPALQLGDYICVYSREYGTRVPMRGEIIVFEFPEDTTKDFVKRVIAVGGDIVEIRDKKVFLNGKKDGDLHAQFLSRETFPAQLSPRDNLGPLVVPEGSLFVMGDNRDFSLDSRLFGFVKTSAVKGKVLFIYWADDKSRIGRSVE